MLIYKRKTIGSALITALFIMALIAAAATAMVYQLQQSINRSQQIFNYNQALQYNNNVVNWAITLLQTRNRSVDTLAPLKMPVLLAQTKVKGGYYRGVILSMQDKFNLNNLVYARYRPGFMHMLQLIFGSSVDVKQLSDAIIDWVSYNPHSNLDADYKKAGLHYKSPHQPMLNISQLRRVLGVNQAIYRRLILYVTAIPRENSTLDINTVSAMVLTSISPKLSLQSANSIISARPFVDTKQMANNPLIYSFGIANDLTVHSDLFDVRSLVSLGQQTLLSNNYLYRNAQNGQVAVIWQTQGNSQ